MRAAAGIIVPVLLALFLFLRFGSETRGLDLRHLERPTAAAGEPTAALGDLS
jgi:hypothetical protein